MVDQPDHRQRRRRHRLADPGIRSRGPGAGGCARGVERLDPSTGSGSPGSDRVAPTVFGEAPDHRVSPEWAAWANGVAVRELDYHDTFLAAEYAHPGDNIPPMVAVAQHAGRTGAELIRGIVTGYEIQIDLAKVISLHEHKIDHVAHLGPSVAAGLGTMLGLPVETIFQSIGQALHVTTATRQSRKGEISSWKAYAPAFAGKMAIEAVDRAMRGQTSPDADLRGRGRSHRLAARRSGCALPGRAAGYRRSQAGDSRQLHEGALGRIPGAGLDRPGQEARRASIRSFARPPRRRRSAAS